MENIFLTFLLLPLFILACIFSFVVPGFFLLYSLKLTKEKDILIISTAVGISLFLLLIYVFSWLNLHYVPLFILTIINMLYFVKIRKSVPMRFSRDDTYLYLLVGIGSLVLVGLTWFSGWEIFGKTSFYGVNAEDGLIHLSRIYNLLHNFPPTHPSLAEVPFRGYHYFYDFLLSRFVLFYHFNPSDLYFRFFSLFSAFFYGMAFIYFLKRLRVSSPAQKSILFFAYFFSGFSVLLSIVKP